jgi:hypothetical protein
MLEIADALPRSEQKREIEELAFFLTKHLGGPSSCAAEVSRGLLRSRSVATDLLDILANYSPSEAVRQVEAFALGELRRSECADAATLRVRPREVVPHVGVQTVARAVRLLARLAATLGKDTSLSMALRELTEASLQNSAATALCGWESDASDASDASCAVEVNYV